MPPACRQRAIKSRYHLIFAAPSQTRPRRVLTHPIAVTGEPDTSLRAAHGGFRRLLRDVFTGSALAPFHRPEALFAGAEACYFFPSSLSQYQVALIVAEKIRLSTIIFPKRKERRQCRESRNFSASASSSSAPSSMVWDTWLPPVRRASSCRRCSRSSRCTAV